MNNLHDETGSLSIDFLAGFTIFLLAFIWIASMVPGILLNLQSSTIDFDAVAYRTGVILAEDPGWPASPPWESITEDHKKEISRFGLAIAKDTPGILSQGKVDRFFSSSFIYPDDYHSRAIFGDYPYRFNISVVDEELGEGQSIGDVLPNRYGYIRRLVKIKGTSNASIGSGYFVAHAYNNTEVPSDFNVSRHEFSILINNTRLLKDMRNPAYQIDPTRDQITINITDLNSTIFLSPVPPVDRDSVRVYLSSINIYQQDGGGLSMKRTYNTPYIDGSSTATTPGPSCLLKDNISLIINPKLFQDLKAGYSNVYLNLTFVVKDDLGNEVHSSFLNNSLSTPFEYNYHPANVTQPRLRDAIVEVAVW